MKRAILAALAAWVACTPGAGAREKARWLSEEPIVLVSNHDSMPIFRRRVGGNTTWQLEDYAREHTEEAVRRLKDLG